MKTFVALLFTSAAAAMVMAIFVPGALGANPRGAVPHVGSSGGSPATPSRTSPSRGSDLPPTPGAMAYHNGHVMHSAVIHTVYWLPSGAGLTFPDSNYQSLINTFAGDVAADAGMTSNVFSNATQYTDKFTGHITYGISYAGALVDTDTLPSTHGVRGDCDAQGDAICLTDAQLAAELQTFLSNNAQPSGFGDIYVLMLPNTVGACFGGSTGGDTCSTNTFCAYHASSNPVFDESDPGYVYAIEPYFTSDQGCNDPGASDLPHGEDADIAINTISHEVNEAITDPLGTGWWQTSNGEEIGDKCNFNFGTRLGNTGSGDYNQVINGDRYMLQREWSNAKSACVQTASPTITSFSPADGAVGTVVTITGGNFESTLITAVKFGTFTDGTFVVDSPTQITAHVPSGFSTGKISVISFAGTAVSAGTFSVPKITGVSPVGAVAGSTVTITGQGLGSTSTVDFQGHTGAVPSVTPTATTVKVLVPNDAHVGHLVVNTANAAPLTSAATFKPLPKITSISPLDGNTSTDVTITGTNLVDVSFTKFGSVVSSSGFVVSATEVHADPPGAPFSSGTVSITTAAGTATSTQMFAISKVASISPTSAAAGATVTIGGQGLGSVTSVDFPGHTGGVLPSVTPTATSVQVLVPSDATVGQLTVNTGNAGPLTTAATFKPLPKITSISPADGGPNTDVTITGTNLLGVTSVKFGSVAAASFGTSTATTEDAHVPGGSFSSGTVTAVTPGGTAVSTQTFAVSKVTSFSPPSATAGATVTISGQGLGSVTAVDFPNHSGVSPAAGSTSTQLKVIVPNDATVGQLIVHPGNATPITTLASFKALPSIASFSPGGELPGATVTMVGANLNNTPVSVKFGTVVASATPVDATHVRAVVPSGFASGKITVTTANGSAVSTGTFLITKPTSMTPSAGPTNASVTIHGVGFDSVTQVTFAGGGTVAAQNVTPTSFDTIVPTGAVTGPLTLHTASGGTIASTFSYTVNFAATGYSPSAAAYGSVITINGVGLTGVTEVSFDGVADGTNITAQTGTSLQVTVPASGNIDGGYIAVYKGPIGVFMNTSFRLFFADSVAQAAPAGGTFAITGTGLDTATSVTINGESASFTHDNDNQLTVTAPNDVADGAIAVVGPGGTLDAGAFTVQIAHSNGLDSNNYFDSAPLGTPGDASTYSYTMGDEARNSWGQEPNAVETGLTMCGSTSYNAAYVKTGTEAAVWVYGGSMAGYVSLNTADNTLTCPTFSDPTWN